MDHFTRNRSFRKRFQFESRSMYIRRGCGSGFTHSLSVIFGHQQHDPQQNNPLQRIANSINIWDLVTRFAWNVVASIERFYSGLRHEKYEQLKFFVDYRYSFFNFFGGTKGRSVNLNLSDKVLHSRSNE